MFRPLLSSMLMLSFMFIIKVFVGHYCISPKLFNDIWCVTSCSRQGKNSCLTLDWLDVEVQNDLELIGLTEYTDSLVHNGLNLMLFISWKHMLCLIMTQKHIPDRVTLIILPYNLLECWPLQCFDNRAVQTPFPTQFIKTFAWRSKHLWGHDSFS